jgi:hypothetical protein
MCKRRNVYLSDSDSRSDTSSVGLGYPSDISVDKHGQPRGQGTGQACPCDENGRYIYSQMGQPVAPSPPTVSPSCLKAIDEGVPVFDQYYLCLNYPPKSFDSGWPVIARA